MGTLLSEDEVSERLEVLEGWGVADGKLHRSFTFADFSEAWGFMSRVALIAEKLDHHPDWSNSWSTVDVSVVSHADGGITDACTTFAERVNAVAVGAR